MFKIVLPGGSGHLGSLLAHHFQRSGDEVVILSRTPRPAPWPMVRWERAAQELEGADAVINLVGRSVDCRYNERNRREILTSRVDSVHALGDAIRQCSTPPRVWLQSSTATIYQHRYDAPNDEHTGILGGDERDVPETWRFSIDVATAWERAFDAQVTPATRKVTMRTAVVLDASQGGAFSPLVKLVRTGLGGRQGDGRQFVSWIHGDDFVRAIRFLLERDDLSGIVNVAAPHPLPNAAFMRGFREACGRRLGLPAPAWLLALGAFFVRTESELLLKSRRVVPARLMEAGFTFDYPEWSEAARNLCSRWRGDGVRY
ncbi:MAG TPA: TIGR01777 family oxidoreductase [Thermoanaerobaculia bacterium]